MEKRRRPSRSALRRRSRPEKKENFSEAVSVLERAGAAMGPDELAARLHVSRHERRAFDVAVAALERSGEVVRNRAGALLVARRIAALAGQIEGHPSGYGFLVRDDGGVSVLLPAAGMRGLMHGDRASVRVSGHDNRGRPMGTVVEVLERAQRRIVGRVHLQHGITYLVPEDRRIAHDIVLPDAGKVKPGQVVTVELVQPPTKHAQPVGRIAEVLGNYADSGMEIEIALRKFDLPHEFPKKALAQAQALPSTVQPKDAEGGRDLRELDFVTIDGETAKDFDDAVYARREDRDWRLWVAIADVSHYVRHGDPLDLSARERGTSVYFPRRVIPMLPEKLSNGLCSLNPDVDRLAMVCEMAITPKGEIAQYEFYNAVFRSHARLTYTEVWAKISGKKANQNLLNLYDVFKVLLEERGQRGAIDFETIETRMIFDPKGKIEKIVSEPRNDAHRLIEECMLAANVSARNFIAKNEHPVLYRVHAAPAEEKVRTLRDFLAELGLQLPGGESPTPKDYGQLLERIRKRPDFTLLQTILLRSLKQAVYSPANKGHFGLAFDAYVHFTSPIRR